jgi:alginate O-acetyltransferase complex protein AlgJ
MGNFQGGDGDIQSVSLLSILTMDKALLLRILERLPLVLVFVVLLALALGLFAAGFSKPIRDRLAALDGPALKGIERTWGLPSWSLEDLMTRRFQRQLEMLVNERLPLRTDIVRAVNQFYYSLFSKSYMYDGRLVFGRHRQLYEIEYIQKYCDTLKSEFTIAEFDQWAAELQQVASFFAQRGQAFIYLITPSKASYFPEFIPKRFECSIRIPRPDYRLAVSALQKSDLHYVDGSRILLDAKGQYPVNLFPRGGTHWTMLGAALTTDALIAEISRTTGQTIPELRFSYIIDENPTGTDVDLLEVANLWRPDESYRVPKVTVEARSSMRGRGLKLALVGDSFLWQVLDLLAAAEIFDQIDYFYYFKVSHERRPKKTLPPVDENDPNTYRDLLAADVVVFEENESALGAGYIKLLREKLLHSGQ